jgi:signal transduction histidine kinase
VVRLSEARLAGSTVLHAAARWNDNPADAAVLTRARASYTQLESVLAEFEATAREGWAAEYRTSGFALAITDYRTQLDSVIRAAQRGETRQFDTEGFEALVQRGVTFESAITESIVADAQLSADETRSSTLLRIGITLLAVLLGGAIAWWMTRSVTRRVKEVATSANQVATVQLPALVEALRDPRGKSLPTIAPVSTKGGDELSDLAEAFNSMQSTLVDVAHEQVEVLRRGVSDIFVTMARRNRSLIDRQLAMLDEFEAEVDDPDVLSNYYQLDHMATRMRRNSESLLVLANAEPKRRRVKATEIDDVVRAAIGEVEDYRRIEIEALESLQVKGNVVADVSHLLAELLDNATSFSPPDSLVRVGGRRAGDSYMLRIVDNGVGIGVDRLRELNELLREPPIVGLSVEPTLGMSVVSLLANRHGIGVTLSQGNPGTTVDVLLPSSLFGPIDVLGGAAPGAAHYEPAPITTQQAAPTAPTAPAAPAPQATPFDTVERHVEPSIATSLASLSFDAAALREERPVPAEPVAASPAFDLPVHEPATPDAVAGAPAPAVGLPKLDMPTFGSASPAPPAPPPMSAAVPAPTLEMPLPTNRSDAPTIPPPAPTAPPPVGPAMLPGGEFDRPLAPPPTADGPSRQPVIAADAHPAPAAFAGTAPNGNPLPTRSPSRGPDGGHDRLATFGDGEQVVTATSSPSALQAALAAFDARRNGDGASLPTRSPADAPSVPGADEVSTAPSRLDPDALRERLRAFQTEFRTGAEGDGTDPNHSTNNADLGGDRR